MSKTKTTSTPTLPPDVLVSDTKYPQQYDAKFRQIKGQRVVATLEFYNVTTFGWCLTTLLISNASRRSPHTTARTYAARIDDGALVRVGKGPHVTQTVTVYVTEKRQKALQRYIDLQRAGEIKANETRDRISTRRAQSGARRAESFLRLW